MKKIVKIIGLTLSLMLVLNTGVKIVSAKTINKKSTNTFKNQIQLQSMCSTIDPDSKGK
ncbi:hypothetical protein ACFIJ5_18090 (plasmid) [Haloimpatiens sp. FM7330]|uniref:hypothetical protein n=1 Tax=Haloimpatiens sp. FM7330 TaxID=3298610 RepID=UPI003629EC2D